jgi:hypothetical protein
MAATQVLDKGLKKDALGFVSGVVIGVASTPHRLIHVTETPVLVVRGSLSSR